MLAEVDADVFERGLGDWRAMLKGRTMCARVDSDCCVIRCAHKQISNKLTCRIYQSLC